MNQIFTISRGRKFVGGLHWQTLGKTEDSANHTAVIGRLAKQLRFDLAVSQSEDSAQVGFAAKKDGYSPGMLSAAALVSAVLDETEGQQDFLCAAKLPDGRFLFVAQSDGYIHSDGDMIGTAVEVRARVFEELEKLSSWKLIIAPVSWEIPGSTERSFLSLIPENIGYFGSIFGAYKLKSIDTNFHDSITKFKPLLIGVVLVGGAYFSYLYWKYKQEVVRVQLAAQILASQKMVEVHPWVDIPTASNVVEACMSELNNIPTLWLGNWVPEIISCNVTPPKITIAWRSSEHTIAEGINIVFPDISVSEDGKIAVLSRKLNLKNGTDELLKAESIRKSEMRVRAENNGIIISLNNKTLSNPLPTEAILESSTKWKEFGWNVSDTFVSPVTILEKLNGPGFRISSISAKFITGSIKWTIEGNQYVSH